MTKKLMQSVFRSWPVIVLLLCFGQAHAAETSFQRETFVRQWGELGQQASQFDTVNGLAVFNNEVFAVDSKNNRIQVFSTAGNFLREWGSNGNAAGQFELPGGIAISAQGDVYVADSYNDRIQVFKTDGTFVQQWGSSGDANGQFNMPVGIVVNADNDVFVTDRDNFRVQVFSADGSFKRKWGTEGEGNAQFQAPSGIAVSASDEVFVADESVNRVQVFSTSGTLKRQWNGSSVEDGDLNAPNQVAVQGNEVFVSDQQNNRIQVFSTNGQFKRQWGEDGNTIGQFYQPSGLAVADTGEIFVSDLNQHIQVFRTVNVFSQGVSLAPTSLSGAVSTAQFKVALFDANNALINRDAIEPGLSADLKGSIAVMPEHVGQEGGLLAVAVFGDAFFMKTANGWVPWDVNPATLAVFAEKAAYANEEDFTIQENINNLGLSGVFNVFVGYRTATGDVHFNAEPFIFAVTP